MPEDSLKVALARLETKMDRVLEQTEGIEDRVKELEKSKNWMAGGLAAMAVCWALILKLLWGDRL